ncbi:hypothetical protein HJA95_29215 [Rhizobium binae]|uniref:hypothetical protein n=1 Tax=Rhizobium binae TaxID=1138190 RepID=UPI001C82E41A|nr:hypothetical protein [Rhizobium binae]MBX4953570.1 hypothetical protein [Rhizobium binae]
MASPRVDETGNGAAMDNREQKASNRGFFDIFQSVLEAIVDGIWALDSEIPLLLVVAPLLILVVFYAFRALLRLGSWLWSVYRSGGVKISGLRIG